MNVPQAAPQSTFVTVLDWIAILLSSFCVLIGLMQNVLVNVYVRDGCRVYTRWVRTTRLDHESASFAGNSC
jgi:hypothetical protein